MNKLLNILTERDLIQQITETGLEAALETPMTLYAGFDPTADSLHIGHAMVLMALGHFQRAGHRVIALVGGGTGLIGDPSGKQAERALLTPERVAANIAGMRKPFGRFLAMDGANPATIVNNGDWLTGIDLISFLRDVGKHFSVGDLLRMESINSRLGREQGISFTEFSYPLLQAYDFLHLSRTENCGLQIGGSDQWGNIMAGIDLIRKLERRQAHGLTLPLLTRADGGKFGKTESGTLWLDPAKTRPLEMFNYLMNTDDRDNRRLLKMLTCLPLEEIEALMASHATQPERRMPQRALALDFCARLYGDTLTGEVARAAAILFGGEAQALDGGALDHLIQSVPTARLKRDALDGVPLSEALVTLGLAASKADARRKMAAGGVSIDGEVARLDRPLTIADVVLDRAVLVRVGKRQHGLLLVD